MRGTPLLLPTRLLLAAGVALTAGTGGWLFAFPRDTASYWAWTIDAAPTAALLGAGYAGAACGLALAARSRRWEPARIVAVAALALTTLMLLATLLHPGPFALDGGGARTLVAWTWLVVYVTLPPALLVILVLQRRAAQGGPPAPETRTAHPATRAALGAAAAALAVVGVALGAGVDAVVEAWPWPLPALAASVVGAWLCTHAVAAAWFALVDPRWDHARIGMAAAAVTLVLDLVAAVRLSDAFAGGASAAVYVGAHVLLLALLAAAALAEEGRLRSREAGAAATPV